MSLAELAALREREAAAAAAAISRIAFSFKGVAEEYKDVYAPLQDDTRLLMQTLVDNLAELSCCSVVVEACCGAGPCATLLAKLLPEAAVFACDISATALAAARRVADDSHAQVHLSRMSMLDGVRTGAVDLVVVLPPYVASARKSVADAAAPATAVGDGPAASCLADADWVFLGGASGTELVAACVSDLDRVLSPTGVAVMCIGNGHAAASIGQVVDEASGGKLMATVAAQTEEENEDAPWSVTRIFRIERA